MITRLEQRRSALLVLPLLGLLCIAYLLPLAWLLPLSIRTETGAGPENFLHAFDTPLYATVVIRTMRVALVCALTCMAIAYPLAWYLSNVQRSRIRFIAALIAVPLLTSTIVRSEAWVFILLPDGLLNSVLALVPGSPRVTLLRTEAGVLIAMIQVLLPVALLPLLAAFYDLDRSLLAAGRSLGAGELRVWREVILPLTAPAAAASFGLVFLLAIGFWVTPSIVGGPRTMLIAPLISQQASLLANLPFAAALALLLLAATGALAGVSFLAYARLMGRHR